MGDGAGHGFARRGCTQQTAQAGDPVGQCVDSLAVALHGGKRQDFGHVVDVEIYKDRTLEYERAAIDVTASAGDLAAVDFDVVAGAEPRVDAERTQAGGKTGAQMFGDVVEAGWQAGFICDQFPAEQAGAHIDCAAASHAAGGFDAQFAAAVEADFARERLMAADDGRGVEVLKSERVGR